VPNGVNVAARHDAEVGRTVKITRVEAVPLGIPFKKPLLMAGRKFSFSETVLVRLETAGRFAGYGEAPVAPFLTGETIPSILAAVAVLSDAIVGKDARDLSALSTVIHRAIVGNAAAKAAVDVALYDAVARDFGLPLYRLLGGRTQSEFGCLTLVGNSDRTRDLSDVAALSADGFTAFKLKVANGDLAEEAATLIEMRDTLGPRALVCADANGGWTAAEAVRFVKLTESASPDFLEQPVAAGDIDGMVRVANASSVPIGADESIHDVADIRHLIECGAASGGAFKIMKLEGITRCLSAIHLCRALGGNVNLSGKFGESSVANAATLSVATAVGGVTWGLSVTNNYLVDDIVREPIVVRNGRIHPIDKPGLGVEIDEAKVRRFELRPALENYLNKIPEKVGEQITQ
jgi:L-alanine-DL-glutamate epimerase-like enolase superfamily enzyme